MRENVSKHSLMAARHKETHLTDTSTAKHGDALGDPVLGGVNRVLYGGAIQSPCAFSPCFTAGEMPTSLQAAWRLGLQSLSVRAEHYGACLSLVSAAF